MNREIFGFCPHVWRKFLEEEPIKTRLLTMVTLNSALLTLLPLEDLSTTIMSTIHQQQVLLYLDIPIQCLQTMENS